MKCAVLLGPSRGPAPLPATQPLHWMATLTWTHTNKKKWPPVSCPHPTIQKETQPSRPASNTENQYSPLLKLTLLNSLYGGYNKAQGFPPGLTQRAATSLQVPPLNFHSLFPLCASHLLFCLLQHRGARFFFPFLNQNSAQYFLWPLREKKNKRMCKRWYRGWVFHPCHINPLLTQPTLTFYISWQHWHIFSFFSSSRPELILISACQYLIIYVSL